MQFVQFIAARADTGAVLPYARATVYQTGTSIPASLFDASGASIPNPVIALSTGAVGFAAANGTYDVQIMSADGTYALPLIQQVQIVDVADLSARVIDYAAVQPVSVDTALGVNDMGKIFAVAGSTDVTMTLPDAPTYVGKIATFNAVGDHLVNITSVDGGGGVEGQQFLILVPGERATVFSDGVTWRVQFDSRRPLSGKIGAAAAMTLTANEGPVRIPLTVPSGDLTGLNLSADTTDGVFKAVRRGQYKFTFKVSVVPSAKSQVYAYLQLADSVAALTGGLGNPTTENAFAIGNYDVGDSRSWMEAHWMIAVGAGQVVGGFVQLIDETVTGTVEYAPGVIVPSVEFHEIISA